MNIAIFGDSFGDDTICWKNQWQDVGPSWIDYLRKFHRIDNFSLGGSCLYYSKKKFDSINLEQYDKVIFLVTESVRRYQVLNDSDIDTNKNWNFSTSKTRMKFYPHQKEYLETIHNFFVHMHNESDEYFHTLMIEDIKRKRPNAMLIYYEDIMKISLKEIDYWWKNKYDYGKHQDARKCHMCEENNLIFGKLVNDSLDNKTVNINVDDYVFPTKQFSYYFR